MFTSSDAWNIPVFLLLYFFAIDLLNICNDFYIWKLLMNHANTCGYITKLSRSKIKSSLSFDKKDSERWRVEFIPGKKNYNKLQQIHVSKYYF